MKQWRHNRAHIGFFISVIGVLLGNGCAQDVHTARGTEALIYTVTHSYQFTLKPNMESAEAEVERIVREARQLDFDADITIRYRSQQGKAFVKRQLVTWQQWGLSPKQYRARHLASLSSDVTLEVELTRFLTETCKPKEIEQPSLRRGCFVDTSRIQQVARPARYLGKQEGRAQ